MFNNEQVREVLCLHEQSKQRSNLPIPRLAKIMEEQSMRITLPTSGHRFGKPVAHITIQHLQE